MTIDHTVFTFFKNKSTAGWIVMILVVAVLLRLPLLAGSFWLDEAAQALESARPWWQQLDIIPDFQPPLLHLILHLAMFGGYSEWWLRLVGALIPGIVTIWVTYLIGRTYFSSRVGLVASGLLATNSFHIFYSQELRPYSLPTMWAVLSWWVLLPLIVNTPTPASSHSRSSSPQWTPWVVYTLLTVLGLYTSYLYPFLVISQVVAVMLLARKQLMVQVMALLGAALTFMPWLPMFWQQLQAGGEVRRQLPGWSDVVSVPQLKSIPLVIGKFIFGVVDLEVNWYFGLTVVGLGVLMAGLVWGSHWRRWSARTSGLIMVIWLVVPLLTAWVISFWIPIVQPKRVLYLLPAGYLLVSVIIDRAWTSSTHLSGTHFPVRRAAQLFLGLLLMVNGYGYWQYLTQPIYQREDWRTVHAQVTAKYPASQSVALFVFPEPFAPWRWYDDGQYPVLSTGTLRVSATDEWHAQLKTATRYQYIIIFDYLRDLTDPEDQVLRQIEAFGYRPVELMAVPQIGFVRIYAQAGTTVSQVKTL